MLSSKPHVFAFAWLCLWGHTVMAAEVKKAIETDTWSCYTPGNISSGARKLTTDKRLTQHDLKGF